MVDFKNQMFKHNEQNTDCSTENENQLDSLTNLHTQCLKQKLLLEKREKEILIMNQEIFELKQRIISLEDEKSNALSFRSEVMVKYSEILSTFQQKLDLNFQRIVQNSVENIYQSSNREITQKIESKCNEIISILNGDNSRKQEIINHFNEILINIQSIVKENFINNNFIHESLQAILTSVIRKEFNSLKEENENFVKGFERVKKEKNDLMSSFDNQIKKYEKELETTENSLELYKSRFDNARLVLKNIFTYYLDQDFFQPEIEKCFANKDFSVEEALTLSKSIKVNLIVKIYYYILNDVIKDKIVNKKNFINLSNELCALELDINNKKDLFNFTEKIKVDESNIVNRIFSQILKNYEEKCFESDIALDKHISNKYQIINLFKEKQDLLKTISQLKEKLILIEESKKIDHMSNKDNNDNIQILSERTKMLEQENKKLHDQKITIKRHTEEVLIKVKNEIKDIENMVDKRVVSNFFLKALDKKSKKNIKLNVRDTLANFFGFNNEERKKIGLSSISNLNFSKLNNTYNPSSTDKVKEISDDLFNFVLNA